VDWRPTPFAASSLYLFVSAPGFVVARWAREEADLKLEGAGG
jgi:hypothetical protein